MEEVLVVDNLNFLLSISVRCATTDTRPRSVLQKTCGQRCTRVEPRPQYAKWIEQPHADGLRALQDI